MKPISRRRLLTHAAMTSAVFASPAILTRPAGAAEFSFKMATTIIPEHPINARAKEASAAILEQSGGRLSIEVFPGYQLGSSTSVLAQVRGGGIQFVTLSGAVLSTLIPISTIYNLAFAFKDYDQVWTAMDGKLGALVRREIGRIGIHALDKHWDLGFRQITTSTKPITGPDDLRNVKLRVPVAPLLLSCFKGLGAAATPINFDELYSALQTKLVDGQENDLIQVEAARLYEVQKYCSVTNHVWDGFFTLVNDKVWQDLPPELREITARNFNAAAERERADVLQKAGAVREALTQKGLIFNDPSQEPFRAKLRAAGFYKEWKSKFGDEAWSLLEGTVGSLT